MSLKLYKKINALENNAEISLDIRHNMVHAYKYD